MFNSKLTLTVTDYLLLKYWLYLAGSKNVRVSLVFCFTNNPRLHFCLHDLHKLLLLSIDKKYFVKQSGQFSSRTTPYYLK